MFKNFNLGKIAVQKGVLGTASNGCTHRRAIGLPVVGIEVVSPPCRRRHAGIICTQQPSDSGNPRQTGKSVRLKRCIRVNLPTLETGKGPVELLRVVGTVDGAAAIVRLGNCHNPIVALLDVVQNVRAVGLLLWRPSRARRAQKSSPVTLTAIGFVRAISELSI